MKNPLKLMAVSVIALLMSVAAFAQTPEASLLPINEPLDVGGTILQPGTYLIRVLPSNADRNKVQITSEDRKTLYATLLTVPHALEPDEEVPNTVFVFYPAGEGMPRALRTWFAENPSASQGGHDIVYEQSRAQQLARLSSSRVVSYSSTEVANLDTAPLQIVTPESTFETYTTPAPVITETTTTTTLVETPTPMMSSETETTVQTTETQPMEMPNTASNTPLLALLGMASLAGAVAFRMARR